MRHDRTVIGYHGCDATTAERILAGEAFKPSVNDYDWLGHGIYFWEYGTARAWRFAEFQRGRGKVKKPAVVGAVIQLGQCLDLMDTLYTDALTLGYPNWRSKRLADGKPLPVNAGAAPDHKLRHLDCAMINWYLDELNARGFNFDTVRCGFVEGDPVFAGSKIHRESHVQLAVRNPNCVLGTFRPTMEKP